MRRRAFLRLLALAPMVTRAALDAVASAVRILPATVRRTLYVVPRGSEHANILANSFHVFPTVKAALDEAHAGDQIVIAPGTYPEAIERPPGSAGASRERPWA